MSSFPRRGFVGSALVAALAVAALARPAAAGPEQNPEWPYAGGAGARPTGDLRPAEAPDIIGAGKVSTVANVWMKTTNIGILGNPFTAQSSDPSAQWPGASGVEYLFFVGLWVGAKDDTYDGDLKKRVSHNTEWRPPSLEPADRIYQTFDGAVGGGRFTNDDGDDEIDEDPLDGHDNDDDGLIDEDFAAISQQMYTCLIRDDTPQALETAFAERHVQRGLEVRQNTYAFSVPGTNDFVSVEWEIENVSGNVLDSVYVGMFVEQDVGPTARDRFFSDDLPEPRVPQGPDPNIQLPFDDPNNPNAPYLEVLTTRDPRFQGGLCPRDTVYINGFLMTDDDGDTGATPGASAFLLLGHTTDPTGVKAPRRVGFRMYTFFQPGVPFAQGGAPTNDSERYQILSSNRNIDPTTGLISAEPPDRNEINDYFSLCSVGPFLDMQPGEKVKVAWALAVQQVDYTKRPDELRERYVAIVENAIRAQKTYRGTYQVRQGFDFPPDDPTGFGRETCLRAIPGLSSFQDCHDDSFQTSRPLDPDDCTWFDLDCSYCTGVGGQIPVPWTASSPPPNPQVLLTPLDRAVRIEWDNRSEYTPDPVEGTLDIAGYKIWKAANWTRPVGSSGPGDDLWSLLATYYLYDPRINPLIEIIDGVETPNPNLVLVNREDPDPANRIFPVLEGELTASGAILHCLENDLGVCDTAYAKKLTFDSLGRDSTITDFPVVKYPVGRYSFTDRNVLNGFLYFYSVTAFDSTGRGGSVAKLEGRQAAVEGDAVVPQDAAASVANGGEPYVVPNPYRGRAEWDLTPSAADPTGTHVDFFNLPQGWTRLRIYTISGDMVQEFTPDDPQVNGRPQREGADDNQASWNLVSRNGQDVVSGIYIFSVEAGGEIRRGKFIVIR